jgi:hypothetical protein
VRRQPQQQQQQQQQQHQQQHATASLPASCRVHRVDGCCSCPRGRMQEAGRNAPCVDCRAVPCRVVLCMCLPPADRSGNTSTSWCRRSPSATATTQCTGTSSQRTCSSAQVWLRHTDCCCWRGSSCSALYSARVCRPAAGFVLHRRLHPCCRARLTCRPAWLHNRAAEAV